MKTPKVIHTYFNPEHINEVDRYVIKQKNTGKKNASGRAYSRNDYFAEALADRAKTLGLKTSPIFEKPKSKATKK